MAKNRIPIPKVDAARVLFASDRTCCVCRTSGKRVQIHHIDDDPSNNAPSNLAVLCFECHGNTQTTGGFGRHLDAEQVRLYRDNWHQNVAARRVQDYRDTRNRIEEEDNRIRYLTTLTERLRENQDYITLATIYDDLGSSDLRDKYIELALQHDSPDWLVIDLRSMQNRRDLISEDVVERRLARQTEIQDWSNRARTLVDLGRNVEAVRDFAKSVLESIEDNRFFHAAYCLKEIAEKGLIESLFEKSLETAAAENDLWWQVRSLQELGWNSELDELLLANEDKIEASEDPSLKYQLLVAKGDEEEADKALIELRAMRKIYNDDGRVALLREDDSDDVCLEDGADAER